MPPITPLDGHPGVTAITNAGPFVDWLALAGGSLWAAGVGDGIGRYDADTGTANGSIAFDADGICLAMDVGFDALWVGSCLDATVSRIDPSSGEVVAIIAIDAQGLAGESSIAAGEGSVWVQGTTPFDLVRIDPETNKAVATVTPSGAPAALRSGFGSLWMSDIAANGVQRLDPITGANIETIPVGRGPRFMAIGPDSVWVLNQVDGTVSRIDPATDEVVATIAVSTRSIEGGDMAFGGGFAWARVSDTLVAKIDPSTNDVIERLGTPAGSGSVAADDSAVWISAHDVGTIWRVSLE